MNSLYGAVAEIGMMTVGPSRTTCWEEWVGDEKETKCGYCNAAVLTTDYFCHNCGLGVKPMPCFHPIPSNDKWGFHEQKAIEPVLIVETDNLGWQVMRVECPECHRKTTSEPRSYFAIREWNQMSPHTPEDFVPQTTNP